MLLQPQFIKAESLLLTTLKHDPCIVTTMASGTSLATTTPVQSASLQVGQTMSGHDLTVHYSDNCLPYFTAFFIYLFRPLWAMAQS